ncbi:MAG: phosphatase PAP2 family protein [Clostridia bacterium]|nr:phosphatase PAP2 family protein [Clostridia bacterium]
MKEKRKGLLVRGTAWLALFIAWTALIQVVDVQEIGPGGSRVGFAALNGWFHGVTGVHWLLYYITDWLGLVPVFICLLFGAMGCRQLITRRSLIKVDTDIIFLGVYYVIVIAGYLLFEMIPINYRPVLVDGRLEASYPSSTTLLVLSVMPTLAFQAERRWKNDAGRRIVCVFAAAFSVFMVIGRLISGVHWLTDIAGSVLLSRGLFCVYQAAAQR